MRDLTDLIIVVTGGTQGLGEDIARRAAYHHTAGLVLCGRNEQKGQRVAAEITELGCPTVSVARKQEKKKGAGLFMSLPSLVAFDLEGVFLPEIWIAVAERTDLPELRRTTRDEPDYDRLMRGRMKILEQHGLTLADIQQVIAGMEPLPGAVEFLHWVRQRTQMVILTDSFYEFVAPFLPKLGWPTVFAHTLEIDARGMLTGYRLRIPDGKRKAVEALRSLGFRTAAVGDSYNDMTMLAAADQGILFRPPENVVHDFPHFPVTRTYDELRSELERFLCEIPKIA